MFFFRMNKVITNGLINYWPINDDLRDYIGSADMEPGSDLVANGGVGFGPDRFGNPTGAINLNTGYYTVPPGVYFNGSFSVLAWVKIKVFTSWSRLFDFGNGSFSYNVVGSYSDGTSGSPVGEIYSGGMYEVHFSTSLSLDAWNHLAFVYNNSQNVGTFSGYINGVLSTSSYNNIPPPSNVVRMNCYIGRSNMAGNPDANAYFDEIKIYNRALNASEVNYDMTVSTF